METILIPIELLGLLWLVVLDVITNQDLYYV